MDIEELSEFIDRINEAFHTLCNVFEKIGDLSSCDTTTKQLRPSLRQHDVTHTSYPYIPKMLRNLPWQKRVYCDWC